MVGALSMLFGAPLLLKAQSLQELGLFVRSMTLSPEERIDIALPSEPSFSMFITKYADVYVDALFDPFLRDFRPNTCLDSQIILRATQAMIEDLYGCASSIHLAVRLRELGWRCYERGQGGVTVASDNTLDLEALVMGRSISPPALSPDLGEHGRRRLQRRLAQLTEDVAHIHDYHSAGVRGDIHYYIAQERSLFV